MKARETAIGHPAKVRRTLDFRLPGLSGRQQMLEPRQKFSFTPPASPGAVVHLICVLTLFSSEQAMSQDNQEKPGSLETSVMASKEDSERQDGSDQPVEDEYPSPSQLLFMVIALVLSMFLVRNTSRIQPQPSELTHFTGIARHGMVNTMAPYEQTAYLHRDHRWDSYAAHHG